MGVLQESGGDLARVTGEAFEGTGSGSSVGSGTSRLPHPSLLCMGGLPEMARLPDSFAPQSCEAR